MSVAKITKAGNQVYLGEHKAFVKNNKTGQITNLRRERNAWVSDLWVKRQVTQWMCRVRVVPAAPGRQGRRWDRFLQDHCWHQLMRRVHQWRSSGYVHCVRGRERNDLHRSGRGRKGPSDHPHLAIAYGFLKANNPDDPADQGSNLILLGAEAMYGLTLAMAVPGKGIAAPWIAKRDRRQHHPLRAS